MASKFSDLVTALRDGSIVRAKRKDLERYAMLVCDTGAHEHFQGAQWPQVADTVRLMLLVRMSEETQTKALSLSKAAIIIACVALVAALVDAGAAVYALTRTP